LSINIRVKNMISTWGAETFVKRFIRQLKSAIPITLMEENIIGGGLSLLRDGAKSNSYEQKR